MKEEPNLTVEAVKRCEFHWPPGPNRKRIIVPPGQKESVPAAVARRWLARRRARLVDSGDRKASGQAGEAGEAGQEPEAGEADSKRAKTTAPKDRAKIFEKRSGPKK